MNVPEKIKDINALENLMAEPYPETIDLMEEIDGDILILGVSGKMGPTLAMLAVNAIKKAGVQKKVFGAATFRDEQLRERLESFGIETIKCDLLNIDEVRALPKVKNVIFMAGRKFGETGSESLTWMMNAVVPHNVGNYFNNSRIIVFSTGCVYPLVSVESGGCCENNPPAPIGEYANSCLGRERIFQYYCEKNKIPVLIYRLNYAIDLRYGVLADIARNVFLGKPVDLAVDAVNFIWQGDANNRALLCLKYASCPPKILNVTGSEIFSVKHLAKEFAKKFNKEAKFTGVFGGKAYLSNAKNSEELFGKPKVSKEQMIKWIAEWIADGGINLDKPTHFSVTDGQFLD